MTQPPLLNHVAEKLADSKVKWYSTSSCSQYDKYLISCASTLSICLLSPLFDTFYHQLKKRKQSVFALTPVPR